MVFGDAWAKRGLFAQAVFVALAIMTNKGGRPPKVPGGFRQVLRIRLTDAERAEYQKAADRAGVPLSEWVRGCLGKAAKRNG